PSPKPLAADPTRDTEGTMSTENETLSSGPYEVPKDEQISDLMRRLDAENKRILGLMADLARKDEALLRYGHHDMTCPGGRACSCGFDAIARDLPAVKSLAEIVGSSSPSPSGQVP